MILQPYESAIAADDVYNVRLSSDVEKGFRRFQDLCPHFDFTAAARMEGEAGGYFINQRSGFGIAAPGKGSQYGKDALIVTRGTKTALDWYTDASVGICLAEPATVHMGFLRTFHSMEKQLVRFFQNAGPFQRVHCIGHSLGGALATLVANWVARSGHGQPVLYTIASPRVGTRRFAEGLTSLIGARNIHRVYHQTDVVPMVPVYPYRHAPMPGSDCFINNAGIPIATHAMDTYMAGMLGKSWAQLHQPPARTAGEAELRHWLATARPSGLANLCINRFFQALGWLLRKSTLLACIGLQSTLAQGLLGTPDVLAQILQKLAERDYKREVHQLLDKAIRATGREVVLPAQLRYQFIRWALRSFFSHLNTMARAALVAAHARA